MYKPRNVHSAGCFVFSFVFLTYELHPVQTLLDILKHLPHNFARASVICLTDGTGCFGSSSYEAGEDGNVNLEESVFVGWQALLDAP
jgi:hypothetical protein